MLNLQEITKTKKLYEVRMPDGTDLTLKTPTQGMFQKMMGIQNITSENPLDALDAVYAIVVEILNLNTQGIAYTKEEVQNALDLGVCVLLIQDYVENTTKILGE